MKTLLAVLTGWMVVSLLLVPAMSGTGTGCPASLSVLARVADRRWAEMDAFTPPAKSWCTVWSAPDELGRISHWQQGGIPGRNEAGWTVGGGRLLCHKEDVHTDRCKFSRFR